MTEPEQPKELTALEKLHAHVREFGPLSLIQHWIDDLGENGAQHFLDKIKGNKPAAPTEPSTDAPTARTKQTTATVKPSAGEE